MRIKYILLFALMTCISLAMSQDSLVGYSLQALMDEAGVPGLSLAYFDNSGEITSYHLGYKSVDSGSAVDAQTVFSAASLSKCIFAYIVMQLAEEGKMSLDRPLMDYFNYEDIAHDERSKKVTARMVLTHTSGLPNWRRDTLLFNHDPGKKFLYSGEGFVWLQKTVEYLTGSDLESLARERVFEPLGMEMTSYLFRSDFEKNHAIPHDEFTKTRTKFKIKDPNAAHSLQTTALDYIRFLQAITHHTGISEQSVQMMLDPQVSAGEENIQQKSIFWGLGIGLQKTTSGFQFWHWGDNGTFKAYFTVDLSEQKGLVYFTNGSNGLSIAREIVELFHDAPQPAVNWMGYLHYKSPLFTYSRKAMIQGAVVALKPYLTNSGSLDTAMVDPLSAGRLAGQWLRERRFEMAFPLIASLVRTFPSNAASHEIMGKYYLLTGDKEKALLLLQKAIALSPSNTSVQNTIHQLTGEQESGTRFFLPAYPSANLVTIAGSFNNWDNMANICFWKDGGWNCYVPLEQDGTYEYNFIVDGVSIPDPGNSQCLLKNGKHVSVLSIGN